MKNIKKLFVVLSAILLVFVIYFSKQIIEDGVKARAYKVDYATLHSVQYGMFNSDIWTAKITQIIDKKIATFNFNSDNRAEVKGYISTIIDTLIEEAERAVKERNHRKRGFLDSIIGSTKQMITDSIIDFKDLKKRIPEFTDRVMKEVEKPENQARVKKVMREKLKEFMSEKFEQTTDMTAYYTVLQKYNTKTLEACNATIDENLTNIHKKINETMINMLILSGIIILLTLLQGMLNSWSLFVLTGTTISLLVSGVMMPMLDIEAKISKLNFTILDNTVVFDNQILFFQSKSISDLVRLLLDSGEARMILVGVLLVMFSIIFPTLKLISTYMYYYSKSIIGNNPITRFFALRSTKWSMADVFVVSIFMAYLGLDGVVNSELRHLENRAHPINIITTNGTHLEVGFFLFLGFVLTSFVLSLMVESKRKKESS